MAAVLEGKLVGNIDDDMLELQNDPEVLNYGKPKTKSKYDVPITDDDLSDLLESAPTSTIIPKNLQQQLQKEMSPLQKSIDELSRTLSDPTLPESERLRIKRDIDFLQTQINYLKQHTKNMASAPFAPKTPIRAGKRTKKYKRSKTIKRKRKNRITNRYRKYL